MKTIIYNRYNDRGSFLGECSYCPVDDADYRRIMMIFETSPDQYELVNEVDDKLSKKDEKMIASVLGLLDDVRTRIDLYCDSASSEWKYYDGLKAMAQLSIGAALGRDVYIAIDNGKHHVYNKLNGALIK